MSARLSGLTIGALTLTPSFDPDTYEYQVTTSAATNKITATPEDENATVAIAVNSYEIENGSSATWDGAENTVEIFVTNGDEELQYTVYVLKTT